MKEPVYFVEDAAEIVHDNISPYLQNKFTIEDIIEILEAEFEFLVKVGIAGERSPIINIPIEIPAQLDEDAMEYFIINNCAKRGVILAKEELAEILEAEMIYLEQLGLIDEEGPGKYCN